MDIELFPTDANVIEPGTAGKVAVEATVVEELEEIPVARACTV